MPLCAHCHTNIQGDLLVHTPAVTKAPVNLHVTCLRAYKEKHAIPCARCGEGILETVSKVGNDYYHEKCARAVIEDRRRSSVESPSPSRSPATKPLAAGGVSPSRSRPTTPSSTKPEDTAVMKCAHCKTSIGAGYVEYRPALSDVTALLHPTCVDGYKQKCAPKCTRCGEKVVDTTVSLIDDKPYHPRCAEQETGRRKSMGPTNCDFCHKTIEGKYIQTDYGDCVHQGCFEKYQLVRGKTCAFCAKALSGEYVTLEKPDGTSVSLHEECVKPYKMRTRPICPRCGDRILESTYATIRGKPYHTKCGDKQQNNFYKY